jgi:uncharacterized protein (DUF433 family)
VKKEALAFTKSIVSLNLINFMETDILKRITIVPGLMGGNPTIRGMRFKVADVLGYLAAGMSQEELLEDFPYLEKDDINASLLYAAKKIRILD